MQKWAMLILVCAACLFGLSVLFTSIPEETHEEVAPPIDDTPVNVAAAEEMYATTCLSCHGDQLQGGAGPALANIGADRSVEQIAGTIQKGKGIMPAFKDTLSADEINNLAKWLSEKK